jgi:hypothetical protein
LARRTAEEARPAVELVVQTVQAADLVGGDA